MGYAAQGSLHIGGEVFPDDILGAEGDEGALLRFALVRHEPAPGLVGASQAQGQAKAGAEAGRQ